MDEFNTKSTQSSETLRDFDIDEILAGGVSPRRDGGKAKSFLPLLKAQLIICMVIVLVAFAVKFIGGDFFLNLRDSYQMRFNDHTSINEILQTSGEGEDLTPESYPANALPVGATPNSEEYIPYDEPIENPPESEPEPPNLTGDRQALSARSEEINTMQWPLATRRITSPFGYRLHPVTNVWHYHRGIDIAGESGTTIHGANIYAALDGIVRTVGYQNYAGNYLIITHSNGLETMYAHASEIIVNEGDPVERGQVIGKVGSTGMSTGPHLHFEVRINGVRINPLWILPS